MASATCDVLVVGGGVIGLSIAYQLASRQAGRITLLEKASAVAEGSTGASSAVLRQRYSNPEMIQLARDGLRAYTDWPAFTRLDSPRATYRRTGMVWLTAEPPGDVSQMAEQMTQLEVDASVLDATQLCERFPALSKCSAAFDLDDEREHRCSGSGSVLFEADAGYTDPVGAAQDLLEASRREGVEVRLRAEVVGLHTAGGRACGVALADGSRIDAGIIVNAAGPWCNALNQMAGLEIPWTLRPTRVQVLHRDRPPEVEGTLPIVADLHGGVYFRPESGGQQILIGSTDEENEAVSNPDHFDRSVDSEFRDEKLHGLHHRLPTLAHRGRVSGLAGLYTVNQEDVHPILGPTELDGFQLANGFSGHGFKLAPMVGSLIARAITGERRDFDSDVPIEFLGVGRDPLGVQTKSAVA